MSIRNRLKEILNENRISQRWLSEETGLSTSSISNIVNEKSEPYAYAIYLIAKALKIKMDEILYDDEENMPYEIDAKSDYVNNSKKVEIELEIEVPDNYKVVDIPLLINKSKGINIFRMSIKEIK